MTVTVSFAQPLPEELEKTHQVVVRAAESSATDCPGVGRADPGFLCVYVGYEENTSIHGGFENPQTGFEGVGRGGANTYTRTSGAGDGAVAGTWAVTAP
jgi:hypothetical protein